MYKCDTFGKDKHPLQHPEFVLPQSLFVAYTLVTIGVFCRDKLRAQNLLLFETKRTKEARRRILQLRRMHLYRWPTTRGQ